MVSSIGYDTLHISLTREQVGESAFWGLARRLERAKDEKDLDSGEVSAKGHLGNLWVRRSPQMVKIGGSLAKWHHKNPHTLLHVDEVPEASARLSDEVGFDVSKGSVKRLDMAVDLITPHPPETYIRSMMGPGNMDRFDGPHSVTWSNKIRAFSAYDKIDDLIENQCWEIPEVWEGQNVMRYEMRILQRVSRILGHDVRLATLEDPGFFDHIVERLLNEYHSIELKPNTFILMNLDKMKPSTGSDPKEQGYAMWLLGLTPRELHEHLYNREYTSRQTKSKAISEAKRLMEKYSMERLSLPPVEVPN